MSNATTKIILMGDFNITPDDRDVAAILKLGEGKSVRSMSVIEERGAVTAFARFRLC